jgi:hypothetical protein
MFTDILKMCKFDMKLPKYFNIDSANRHFHNQGEPFMTSFESSPEFTMNQVPNAQRKKPIRLIVIIALVVIIVIASSAVAYAKFDVFKSPKTLYLQSELNSLNSTNDSFSLLKNKIDAEVQPLLDKPAHYMFDISNLTIDTVQLDAQTQSIMDLIKKTKLGYDIKQDWKSNTSLGKLNLNIDNKDLINIETAFNKEKLAIRIPEIFDKYGYINFKDLETLQKKLNANNLPKKIVTYQDLINAVSIKQKELSEALMPYALLYAENIDPKQVTLKKNGLLTEGSSPIKVREITVAFNQSDIKRLVNSLVNKMQDDIVLQNLIYTRSTNVIQLLIDSGSPVKEISKVEFLKNWKQAAVDLKKLVEKNTIADGASMVLYIDNSHHILERKFSLQAKGKEGKNNNILVKTASWNDASFLSNSLFFASIKDEAGEGGELKWANASNVDDKGGKGTFTFNIKSYAAAEVNTAFLATIDYDLLKSKDKESGSYTFNLTVPGNDQNSGTIKGSVTATTAKSDNTKDSNIDVNINLQDVKYDNNIKGIKFKLHTKRETIQEVKLPVMSADNSIELVNMSDDQRSQLLQDLGKGVQSFIEKNSELAQSFGSSTIN